MVLVDADADASCRISCAGTISTSTCTGRTGNGRLGSYLKVLWRGGARWSKEVRGCLAGLDVSLGARHYSEFKLNCASVIHICARFVQRFT